MHEINYKNIPQNNLNNIFIDVRSPKEFNKETIPGSINIPIFDDKERELIGTLYKNDSIEEAKKNGIEIVAKKLTYIYERISDLNKDHNHIYIYCSRGGFRSSSLVSLFNALNINITKLHGGYKEYRAFIREELPIITKDIKFIVVYGNTGTGKTHILNHLKEKGLDVLNLEECANHRGSILGSVGLGSPNSQKMFESLLFDQLNNRSSNLVFVEGESRRIGKVLIPDFIFDKMQMGIKIKITATIERRVEVILSDYVNGFDDELIEALNHMKNRFGDEVIDNYIDMVDEKDYSPIIKNLFVNYYDPLYEKHKKEYVKVFENVDSNDTAKDIIRWLEDESLNDKIGKL